VREFWDFVTGNWARPRGRRASAWVREYLWRSTIFVMLRYAKDISDDRTKLKLENRELRRRLEELEG
jgi:hypothetical protein